MSLRDSAQVRVGIFVFAGVFLAMATIFLLGGERQLFKRQYRLKANFTDISGLRVGAGVQLAGVNVGTVERIIFSPEINQKKIEVRLSISRDFQERIRQDSTVSIHTQGLLGDKIIFISVGSPNQPVLDDWAEILSADKGGLSNLAETGDDMIKDAQRAVQSLGRILTEVEKGHGLVHSLIYETDQQPMGRDFAELTSQLKEASRELNQILKKINKGEGTVGALLQDPSLYYDIRRLFSKVERNKILTHIIRSRVKDPDVAKVPH